MYRTLLSAAFVGLTGVSGVYEGMPSPSMIYERLERAATPCAQTVTYSLGTIDADAGYSNGEILAALSDAAAAWDKAAGRVLFAYAPGGGDIRIDVLGRHADPLVYAAPGVNPSYTGSPFGERIVLANVDADTHVRHVFAHEFGHALGLPDSSESADLMHLLGTSTAASTADADALRALCGEIVLQ